MSAEIRDRKELIASIRRYLKFRMEDCWEKFGRLHPETSSYSGALNVINQAQIGADYETTEDKERHTKTDRAVEWYLTPNPRGPAPPLAQTERGKRDAAQSAARAAVRSAQAQKAAQARWRHHVDLQQASGVRATETGCGNLHKMSKPAKSAKQKSVRKVPRTGTGS